MPSKAYIQQLQRLFAHFQRHGGRNKPRGITQVELVDGDDLTRWFVQLLYADENGADFYVSLELVFSEDGEAETDELGPTSNRPHQRTPPAAAPAPSAQTSLMSSSPHDTARPAAGASLTTPPLPRTESTTFTAAAAAVTALSPARGPAAEDNVELPRSHESSQTAVAAAAPALTATARPATTTRCRTRMPLVFVVAPRLIAAFVHHGALCSLELMSHTWEPTAESMTLLLIALHETLNPFSGDGRVSIDDAERAEHRRAAVVAAGGVVRGGGGPNHGAALASPGTYSAAEHRMGIDYIRRAHPHLFRRHVTSPPETPPDGDGGDAPAAVPLVGVGAATAATQEEQSAPPSKSVAEGVEPLHPNPQRIGDIARLNTAVFDALAGVYATAAAAAVNEAADAHEPPCLLRQSSAPRAPCVALRLDTAALLADAQPDTPAPPAGHLSAASRRASSAAVGAAPGGLADASTTAALSLVCTPALHAERVLRARPPSALHLAHAPTSNDAVTLGVKGRAAAATQRVAELWIPRALPRLPSPSTVAPERQASVASGGVSQAVRLIDDSHHLAGSSGDTGAPSKHLCSLEVCLTGDLDSSDDVAEAPIACLLRNMRVSVNSIRASSSAARSGSGSVAEQPPHGSVSPNVTTGGPTPRVAQRAAPSSLRFSLQPSTAPSPEGDVHACEVPHGLSLRLENLYLYGHLRVLGSLTLHNCVLVGSLTTEEFASVQVTQSRLALTPDDRLLRRAVRSMAATQQHHEKGERSTRRRRSASREAAEQAPRPAQQPQPPPPPPPALFYTARKECLLVLDSSMVDITEDSRVYRLPQRAQQQRNRLTENIAAGVPDHESASDNTQSAEETEERLVGEERNGPAAPSPLAAMMTVLRTLILVSNQGRLRLVRCTVDPGCHTERTIFAEQDAVVDMAYCTVTAAISSAVIVQGCRAFLEHCIFVGTPATDRAERRDSGGGGGGDDARHPPAARPQVMGHADSVRSTGLIVELGGTLTARFCTARHLYFAFCVIAHSVAHLYRCHAEDAVNGYTVDASAATLDGCSANTNHVGVFVLRKAKCILTDETGGSFSRRCTELAAAHTQARRTVLAALQAAHQGGRPPPPPSAAAVAATTAWVASLARQYYAERLCGAEMSTASRSSSGSGETSTMAALPLPQLLQGATAGSEAAGTPSDVRRGEGEGIAAEDGVVSPHFGFHGGSFSLEVRDAALKARGVTLMNASDTAVYAVDQSTVELEDCVLWSTAEAEDAAHAAAVAAEEEAARRRDEARRSSSFSSSTSSSCRSVSLDAAADVIGDAPLQLKAHRLYTRRRASQRCSGAAMAAAEADDGAAAAATSAASTKMHPMAASSATPPYRRAVLGPRLSSCGVKTVHSTLTARRCLVTGFGFGVGTIESSTAELTECMAAHGMNGFTVDHSSCHLRDCGANASHVAIFALNGAVVTVEGVPHVVGVSSAQRPPPRRICGGLAALYSGDAYGVECKASELHCTGVTVRRGRDSGFNVYNKSTCTLHRCLVDMASGDAVGAEQGGGRVASHTAAAVDGEPWLHHLSLDPYADMEQNAGEGGPAAAAAEESGSDAASSSSERDGACRTDAAARSAAGAVGSTPAIATRVSPSPKPGNTAVSRGECGGRAPRADSAVLTSGVKVWSGSRCVAQDSEVRSVTFGFAALGPDTTLEAHHCTAKHVVNGFTADGGSMQLTKCSASSNHVGVYVLSHGRCVVRRGSYTAKKYGIECRGGVLSFQGHVKIYGFARIGLYLYAGAHCEADSDSVLDIQAHKQQQQHQQQQQQQQPSPLQAAAVSPCGLEEAASVADLLPACVALDDATAHVPQAVLGGGARCGITCAAAATAFVGQCLVHDCTLVGVNVFAGAHLTLSNCQLRCARRYAVVVHVGGVCRITGHDEAPRRISGGVRANAEERSGASHPSAAAVALPGLRERLWEAARGAVAAVARRAMPQRWLSWIAGSRFTAAGSSGGRRRSGTTAGASKRPGATTAALLQEALAAYHAAVKEEEAGLSLVNPTSAIHASLADRNSDAVAAVKEEECCLVPPYDAASHLRWLTCKAHSIALQFRLNPLVSISPAAAAAGVAPAAAPPEAATDSFRDPPQSAASPSHATTTVAGSGDATASSLSPSSPPYAPALPPVWPCIVGSCVVRGTCVMERVRLCPTPLPQWPDAGQPLQQRTESGERGKREEVSDDSSGTSHWSSTPPQRDAAAEDCAMEENSAGDTVDGADDAGDLPALYVTQHGVLHLTDCIVDTSLVTHHAHRAARADPSAAAVLLLCDGPYARLHCDYVRALSYGDDDCGWQEGVGGTTTTASGALKHRTLSDIRSCAAVDDGAGACSPIPSVSCGGTWADGEEARPRLVLSLRNGAECTLHGLGAALHSWPFSAFAGVAEGRHEGSQAGFRVPSARHRGERDALTNEPEKPAAARADTAGCCDGGVALRLSEGSLAEASFSAFANVAASSQSTLRIVRCAVQGETHPPLRLSRGSSATLLFCQLVRAKGAAAATVASDARCVLFRTALQTAVVACADGGEVVQVQCGACPAAPTDDRGA